ncbi:hypothetical protein GGX14DRAFT_435477 [Mycena pura]|uniref:Uncharacterized protein n=1 Tax=Mycena pura TaxID=153505 RepID=A0AAD6VPN7_9AGAR|nr:hypothetical protein GGX14DRAFT_435477 [Mycena pura]
MPSHMIKLPTSASEDSGTPRGRRKAIKRVTPADDDASSTTSAPAPKRPRLDDSEDDGPESAGAARPARSTGSRTKTKSKAKVKPAPKTKRLKVVISDPESEEFELGEGGDESESEAPIDDDEYMSEPKSAGKRAGGRKTEAAVAKGAKGKEIMARDERKRPVDATESGGTAAAKRPRAKPTQAGEPIDVVGDAAPPSSPASRDDAAPVALKKKLPAIKKNKQPTGAGTASVSASANSTPSMPSKPLVPTLAEEDNKLPLPVVVARKPATGPVSTDLDLSNPTMYAELFKTGAGSTVSGFTRRDKEEERRKELSKMRDEARAKRIGDAAPAFDLQAQTDKISRFEEKLRLSRSPAVYPNHLAGALRLLDQSKNRFSSNDLEDGEM